MQYSTLKVVFLGDRQKIRAFAETYTNHVFNPEMKINVGVDFYIKEVNYPQLGTIRLQIWAESGEEKFRFIMPTYIKGASAVVLFLDTESDQFQNDLVERIHFINIIDDRLII